MRIRLMASLTIVAASAVLTGCGGGSDSATQLSVRLSRHDVDDRVFTVRCNPAGGNVGDPEAVCSAIERSPGLLRFHAGRDHPCPSGAPAVRVAGKANGERVAVTFAPCKWGQEQWAWRWTRLVGQGSLLTAGAS